MSGFERLQKAILVVELCVAVVAVVLFGFAYPDRFRSKLWEYGGIKEWNSNPNLRIYFYANYRSPPDIPFIWSQRLTDSNLAIAILTFVVAFSRAATSNLGYLPRTANVLYDILLLTLWAASIIGQASGDDTDPEHVAQRPWYLERSCGSTETTGCVVSRASFAVAVIAGGLYGARIIGHALISVMGRRREESSRWEKVGGQYHDPEEIELGVEVERRQEALSPVLAFFPASRHY